MIDATHRPDAIAAHYRRFRVDERVLLTGHSHQAWPDVAFDGHERAWLDAALHVDDKWEAAFAQAAVVRRGFAGLIGESEPNNLVLGSSTHDLLVRFLSALPLRQKPKIVTSDGEFHSMRRQLTRLEEEGVEVVRVASADVETLVDRIIAASDRETAAVMVSAVMFKNAAIVPHLDQLAASTQALGIPLVVDAYHAVNIMPFGLETFGLTNAFIVAGGYKYCQMGEGNCFMRVPTDCEMRPIVTGWYAEFEELEGAVSGVPYPKGAARFQGSTYDPTSHYRAAAVFDFFATLSLDPQTLRAINQRQKTLLHEGVAALALPPSDLRLPDLPLEATAGFLSFETRYAEPMQRFLKEHGVFCDFRGNQLRLGPAPYVTDSQLDFAVDTLAEAVRNAAQK